MKLLTVALLAAVAIVATAGHSSTTAPDGIPISGPTGEPVVCADGQPLTVTFEQAAAPLPEPASDELLDGYVWRCGSSSEPALVPFYRDPLRGWAAPAR